MLSRRAQTRSITYTFPEDLGKIEIEQLVQKIVEKINKQQDIYLVLDQTKFGPAPNFSGKNIYVLHSWTVRDGQYSTNISASLLRDWIGSVKTTKELIDLLWKEVDSEPLWKWDMDKSVNIFYNKIDHTLDITGREYKDTNPNIKY